MEFSKVAVLGGGLLGGSVALAMRGRGGCALWARRVETVADARRTGVEGATADLAEAVADAELIVLSVPVGAMRGLLRQAIDAGARRGALVSDVGSVKGAVHTALGPLAREAGLDLIGGHPMAGSERQGFAAARAGLFEDATCLLTDDERVGNPAAARLEGFWRGLGCRVSWMSAAEHDRLVARISHLPHAMAAVAASVAMASPDDSRHGGGGLRDTTRVAAGDPAMWTEILLENAAAVSAPLREARDLLGEMLAMIERGDHEALRRMLETARDRHAAGAGGGGNREDD